MPDKSAVTKTPPSDLAESDARHTDSGLDQVVEDTKNLSEDVAEWLRLKLTLIQIEIRERITDEVNAILTSILVLGIIMIAMLLGLIALSMYIGMMVGNDAYGFAIVGAFVALVGILVGRSQPQWLGRAMYRLVPRRWYPGKQKEDDKPAGS